MESREGDKMRDKHSQTKILLSIVGILVVLGGATGIVWLQRTPHGPQKATVHIATTVPAGDTKGTSAAAPVSYKGEEGKTALELLKATATVVTKDSSYGPYVDSINGVKGGTNGKYWTFYINGQKAQVGAGAYATKSGDNIEWKFE
jgi:hypothetical protein